MVYISIWLLENGELLHTPKRFLIGAGGIIYLLTYDSYVPLYNRFHRGEWITRVSGGEGALDTPGLLNGTSEASAIWVQECPDPGFPDPGSWILDPNPILF
jgi:hypothetical protein